MREAWNVSVYILFCSKIPNISSIHENSGAYKILCASSLLEIMTNHITNIMVKGKKKKSEKRQIFETTYLLDTNILLLCNKKWNVMDEMPWPNLSINRTTQHYSYPPYVCLEGFYIVRHALYFSYIFPVYFLEKCNCGFMKAPVLKFSQGWSIRYIR